jgi:Arc/MetJ family transcription regulator
MRPDAPLVYLSVGSSDILIGVSKRLVDIDDALLHDAAEILGASTMKETVNRALGEVVAAARRRRHADRLARMEGLDLDKPKVMSRAWR